MSRTILEIVQSIAPRIGLDAPSALFSSTDRTEIELREVAMELSDRIVRLHDWSLLYTQETHTGDGTTTDFDLPTDFLRMPKEGQIWSTRWERPLLHISAEDYLQLDVREYDLITGTWTKIGGDIKYRPALASGEDAKFWYISNKVIQDTGGTNKARFTDDTDTFRLDDRMLELALIWEWRQRKGLDYSEDMITAEQAIAQEISRDKGARIITQNTRRNVRAQVAYPWQITP